MLRSRNTLSRTASPKPLSLRPTPVNADSQLSVGIGVFAMWTALKSHGGIPKSYRLFRNAASTLWQPHVEASRGRSFHIRFKLLGPAHELCAAHPKCATWPPIHPPHDRQFCCGAANYKCDTDIVTFCDHTSLSNLARRPKAVILKAAASSTASSSSAASTTTRRSPMGSVRQPRRAHAGDHRVCADMKWGSGAWGRIRTTDTRIFNPLLYQLSYPGLGPRSREACL